MPDTFRPQDQIIDPVAKAEDLYNDYLAGGSKAASRSLREDFANSAQVMSPEEHNNYWNGVSKAMADTGHLPNITVAYLKENFSRLDLDNSGTISKSEVKQMEANGGLDKMMARTMMKDVPAVGDEKTFYDQIASKGKAWQVNPNEIELHDLNKWGRQQHRAERREHRQDKTAEQAAPLYDNNEELLHHLDNEHRPDGFISRKDMKTFLKHYQETPGEGIYTKDNAEFVNDLLKGKLDYIKHGRGGISFERLDRKTGDDREVAAFKPTLSPDEIEAKPKKVDTAKEKEPVKSSEQCVDEAVRKQIDQMATLRTNEGYSHVACRLLGITIDGKYSPDEKRDMTVLSNQLKDTFNRSNTHRLLNGSVIPVSANLDKLCASNPKLARRVDEMRRQAEWSLE